MASHPARQILKKPEPSTHWTNFDRDWKPKDRDAGIEQDRSRTDLTHYLNQPNFGWQRNLLSVSKFDWLRHLWRFNYEYRLLEMVDH